MTMGGYLEERATQEAAARQRERRDGPAAALDLGPVLADIRRQFYAGKDRAFFRDRRALEETVTWPATWLRRRGVTWTPERYFATIRGTLAEIVQHGSPGAVGYFPRYLLKALQNHFAHHSDTICAEASRARNAFAVALGKITAQQAAAEGRNQTAVDVLAAAHDLLAKGRPARKAPTTKTDDQLNLI